MYDTKEERIEHAGMLIREIDQIGISIRYESIRVLLEEMKRNLADLRDTQYLFDSGEKELIRLYDRYMPYFMDILKQYASLEVSGNYDAIQKSRSQLEQTLIMMNETIRSVARILPQDEIDEANARARAEELQRMLEEQRRSVLK